MLGLLYYFRGQLLSRLATAAALIGTVAGSYIRAKGASLGVVAIGTNVTARRRARFIVTILAHRP
jgi:hypothetical protein